MKSASFDLHLHSHWSYDANASVEFYFAEAEKKKLRAIAITEHHQMDSIGDILAASARHPSVHWIPGAELTVNTSFGAIDMVCLGMPVTPTEELQQIFDEYHAWQRAYGAGIARVLATMGHDYGDSVRRKLLLEYRPAKTLDVQGVTHVNFLVQETKFIEWGWSTAENMPKFWEQIEESGNLPKYPSAERVIPAVKRAGGLVFIAHPLHYFQKANRHRMDALREELNFDGVECAHPMFGPELSAIYRDYCLEHGLLSTAGSDTHSMPEFFYLKFALENVLAGHGGLPQWYDEIAERLKK